MEKNWIKIFTSFNFYQSEIVKQVLIEHQIDAVLLNRSSHHAYGKNEVYIHKEDFSHAIEIMVLNEINI